MGGASRRVSAEPKQWGAADLLLLALLLPLNWEISFLGERWLALPAVMPSSS